MAARFIVNSYVNRNGNPRVSVLMSLEDALRLAVENSETVSAVANAVADALNKAADDDGTS